MNWGGICKAADYRVYREVAGSNSWSLIATVQPPNPATLDPASTSNVSGGGMAPVSYTDTGAAGTPEPSWVPPTTENAVETNYQQNANLIPALTALGVTAIGADASKPYPNPPQTQFSTSSPYNGGTFAAGTAFADGPATAVPRHPINIYFNAATQAEMVNEYNTLYVQNGTSIGDATYPAEVGHCTNTTITTCLTTPATWASIVTSVESGMFGTVINNDPEPFYAHQTNLVGGPALGVLYPVLNQLLTSYHNTFSANEPYVQPTLAQAADVLSKQAAWSAAFNAGTITATEMGGTIAIKNNGASTIFIPVTAPTGTLIEPAATPFGSAYAGSLSDWVSLAPGATYNLQAPAAPYITTQPANQSLLAGRTVTFTAAATNGQANPPATVQWDVSTNNGLTWTAVAGATSPTLDAELGHRLDEQQRVRGDLHQQPRQRDQQRRPVGGESHHPDRHAADRVDDHLRPAARERDVQRRDLQRPRAHGRS